MCAGSALHGAPPRWTPQTQTAAAPACATAGTLRCQPPAGLRPLAERSRRCWCHCSLLWPTLLLHPALGQGIQQEASLGACGTKLLQGRAVKRAVQLPTWLGGVARSKCSEQHSALGQHKSQQMGGWKNRQSGAAGRQARKQERAGGRQISRKEGRAGSQSHGDQQDEEDGGQGKAD